MISAAIVSMNMPTTSSSRFIRISTAQRSLEIAMIPSVSSCGTRSEARIQPNTLAKPTSTMIAAPEIALSAISLGMWRQESSR